MVCGTVVLYFSIKMMHGDGWILSPFDKAFLIWSVACATVALRFCSNMMQLSHDLAKLLRMSFVMYENNYFSVLKNDSYKILEPLQPNA